MKSWLIDIQARWRRGLRYLIRFMVAMFFTGLVMLIIQAFSAVAADQSIVLLASQILCFLVLAPLSMEIMLPSSRGASDEAGVHESRET
jgi:hypothetical protein